MRDRSGPELASGEEFLVTKQGISSFAFLESTPQVNLPVSGPARVQEPYTSEVDAFVRSRLLRADHHPGAGRSETEEAARALHQQSE
ncbi:hypothetical protein SAMN05661093_09490 [Kibdelosporangium aridum]|uniref:Uncharacterized protein n=1 Tax=Kibdelosporangium aridum TaxID=2030 RepID=A0A1W2FW09_KIBAR|nr:hypothetical protein SAMN05661093_09490 [Kibdelosporangium aridum]